MADVGRQFANVKVDDKTMTSVNLPSGFGLKGMIEYELDRLSAEGKLKLKLPTRKALVDHTATCPNSFGKAMHPKTTKKGFIVNGMLDENIHTYPDIVKLLKTCKLQDFKQEYEDLVFSNFSELYQCMKTHGHIPEEVYNRMGFIKDTDYKGKEVAKPDEVSQEMRHRAKIISHELQCKLRRGKEEKAAEEEKRKKTNESIKRNKLLNENGKAIEEIF